MTALQNQPCDEYIDVQTIHSRREHPTNLELLLAPN